MVVIEEEDVQKSLNTNGPKPQWLEMYCKAATKMMRSMKMVGARTSRCGCVSGCIMEAKQCLGWISKVLCRSQVVGSSWAIAAVETRHASLPIPENRRGRNDCSKTEVTSHSPTVRRQGTYAVVSFVVVKDDRRTRSSKDVCSISPNDTYCLRISACANTVRVLGFCELLVGRGFAHSTRKSTLPLLPVPYDACIRPQHRCPTSEVTKPPVSRSTMKPIAITRRRCSSC